jgi:AraC-like DNA-binding protein
MDWQIGQSGVLQWRMPAARTSRPLDVRFDPSGICILRSRHSDDFRMDWTRHAFWKVLLVISGAGRLFTHKNQWRLAGSDLALVPPGIMHRLADEPGAPLSIYVLCAADEAPFDGLRDARVTQPVLVRNAETMAFASGAMRRLLIERARQLPGCRLISTGLAALLFGRIEREITAGKTSSAPVSLRKKVESYIRELRTTFCEPDTLDAVASRLGLSRRRFTQLFREFTGESWLSNLRRLRLEHAKRLLRDPGNSIAAVAFECGFEDLSHFYRSFKTHARKAPRQWRLSGQ